MHSGKIIKRIDINDFKEKKLFSDEMKKILYVY